MDGRFDDWSEIEPEYMDSTGDGSLIDFGAIHIANDDEFLFMKIDFGAEFNLLNDEISKMYLDTDNDIETGYQSGEIGAELVWNFGNRNGTFYFNEEITEMGWNKIALRTNPTVTSNEFEIALRRNAMPDNEHLLFSSDTIKVMFLEYNAGFCDSTDLIEYSFDPTPVEPPEIITFDKEDESLIRMVTWNVLVDGIFVDNRREKFRRVLQALQPDIINFQEIHNHDANDVLSVIQDWLPGEWYAFHSNQQTTVSKFPVITDWPSSYEPIHDRIAVVPIQIDDSRKIIVFNTHLTCCGNNTNRQLEADSFIAYLREIMTSGGTVDLDENTPFFMTGDLNLVGYAQQLETLLHGDIINENEYGEDFLYPDWDNTDLKDLFPRLTEKRMAYTWRNDASGYSPGKLDYFITSDFTIEVEKSFIVCTTEMSDEYLELYGLYSSDTPNASDHLPVVADMRIEAPDLSANFTADTLIGSIPFSVSFTDGSYTVNNIISWNWDFENDGIVDSDLQNPIFTIENEGQYSISLTVEDDLGNIDSVIKMNYITAVDGNLPVELYATSFETSIEDWEIVSITSSNDWQRTNQIGSVHPSNVQDGSWYMYVNAYDSDEPAEDWLISQTFDFTNLEDAFINFYAWTKYSDSITGLELFASGNYAGNPSTTTWTEIPNNFSTMNENSWTFSEDISLNEFLNESDIVIAFKYTSTGTTSGEAKAWAIDNLHLWGTEENLSGVINFETGWNLIGLPLTFSLSPAYPNPFNPKTVIRYQLSVSSLVTLQIYDITGRLVETMVNGEVVGGYHTLQWDASNHSSGMYFVQMVAGEFVETQKILLLK